MAGRYLLIHIQDFSHPAVRVKSEDTASTFVNRNMASTISNWTEAPQQNVTINRKAYRRMLDQAESMARPAAAGQVIEGG